MVSSKRKNWQEDLPAQPVNLEQIPTSQISVPESQVRDIPTERHEALVKSLTDRGSNLIPLIVRLGDNDDSQQQYEVVRGADWCQVAKKADIKELWAWIYEMTDEQAEIARAEMEELTQPSVPETQEFDRLLQQFEVLFDRKLDSLKNQIEQSIKKNEEILKKQVKSLQDRSTDLDQIEQIKKLITNLENSVNNKVETLVRKNSSTTTKKAASNSAVEVNVDLLSKQLDDLDKQIEKKLEGIVKTINQYISKSIQDIEDDLKTQVSAVRSQLNTSSEANSKVEAEVEPETTTTRKTSTRSKPSATRSKAKTTTAKTTTTARKTKAKSAPAEPETPIDDYDTKSLRQLKKIAQERKLRGYARMKRPEILKALREADAAAS
ncbi:MAG: Rho termination factor N-terminal domain-containing protein [Microcoleaceae cyanobacterium]